MQHVIVQNDGCGNLLRSALDAAGARSADSAKNSSPGDFLPVGASKQAEIHRNHVLGEVSHVVFCISLLEI